MHFRVPRADPDRLHEDASWSVGGVARGSFAVLPPSPAGPCASLLSLLRSHRALPSRLPRRRPRTPTRRPCS